MRLAALLLLLLLPGPAQGAGLEGLFGVRLAEPCAVCEAGRPVPEASTGGLRAWRVRPPEPLAPFEACQVRSDAAGRVVDVAAVRLLQQEDEASQAFAALRERFTRELGEPEVKRLHRAVSCVFQPAKGRRVLTLVLREDLLQGRWVLYVNAMDRKLFEKAREAAR